MIKELMETLGVDCPIYLDKRDRYTGTADILGLSFPQVTIDTYKEHPYILKFFAAHELIHYKNKDFDRKSVFKFIMAALLSFIGFRGWIRYLFAFDLLCEMRANIDGVALAGLTHSEIDNSQDLAQEKNKDSKRPKSYKSGYPDREMIKDYTKRYTVLDKNVAAEILKDYCDKLEIKKEDVFIQKVILNFFPDSSPSVRL